MGSGSPDVECESSAVRVDPAAKASGGRSDDIKSGAGTEKQRSRNTPCEESDSDSYSEEDVDISAEVTMTSSCLFCSKQFDDPTAMYVHCQKDHSFDIVAVLNCLPKLEQVYYAVLINFIRAKTPAPEQVQRLIADKNFSWDDKTYIKSVKDGDGVLCFDVTEDLEELSNQLGKDQKAPAESVRDKAAADAPGIEKLRRDYADLLDSVHSMRTAMRRILEEDASSQRDLAESDALSRCDDDSDSCYNRLAIHAEMLKDEHRTSTYIRALDAVFDHLARHKMLDGVGSLLDVGCGTGILALAAMRAAKRHGLNDFTVIAVDHAQRIIKEAKRVAEQNGKPYDEIHFISDSVEHCQLPLNKVDILVSEWMGYGLFSECMLDCVITARDRFLRSDGLILPHQCSLYACLISDDEYYKEIVEYWSDVYGFRMDNLANMALCEASVEQVTADSLVSSCECVKVVDLKTCDKSYIPFESELQFKINRTCIVHGITMFFTADFQNFDSVRTERLSTAPTDRTTHWKQSTFFLHQAMMVTVGDVIDCTVRFSRNVKKPGRVDVSCSIFEQSHTYLL